MVCLGVFVTTVGQLNWNGPAVSAIRGHRNGHRFAVTFRQAEFAPRGRHIFWRYIPGSMQGHDQTTRMYMPAWRSAARNRDFKGLDSLNRKEIAGESAAAFLAKHYTELVLLTVVVDGHRWLIPRRAYAGLLDPDLGSGYEKGSLSPDGMRLKVRMDGSDGGGGYAMVWVFRKSGKYSARDVGEDQSFKPLR